jgi:hypothetical protein
VFKILVELVRVGIFLSPAMVMQAQTADIAGYAVLALQEVTAAAINGDSRQITRRSEVYTGDTIQTDSTGTAHIRMIDSAVIALRCSSALKIDEYADDQTSSDKLVLSLTSGSLRTIIGSDRTAQSALFQLHLSNTTINSKGADFEASLREHGAIYLAVHDGSITVANEFGALVLGDNTKSNFALVEANAPPTLLQQYPAQLNASNCL